MDLGCVLWLLIAFSAGGMIGLLFAGMCRAAGTADLYSEIARLRRALGAAPIPHNAELGYVEWWMGPRLLALKRDD